MKLYLLTKQDWIRFVSGEYVIAYKEPVENYYKEILVAHNEIILIKPNTVTIIKKY